MSSIRFDEVIRAVAEMPDRDSLEDQPEMILVSADEVREILEEQIAPLQHRLQPCMMECFGPTISADK